MNRYPTPPTIRRVTLDHMPSLYDIQMAHRHGHWLQYRNKRTMDKNKLVLRRVQVEPEGTEKLEVVELVLMTIAMCGDPVGGQQPELYYELQCQEFFPVGLLCSIHRAFCKRVESGLTLPTKFGWTFKEISDQYARILQN